MAHNKQADVLRRIQIILPGDDYNRLLSECEERDTTISQYGRQIIRKALKDEWNSKTHNKNDDQRSRKYGFKNPS